MSSNKLKGLVISTFLFSNFLYVTGCSTISQTTPNTINNDVTQSDIAQSPKKVLSFSKVTEEKYNELNNFMARGLNNTSTSSSLPGAAPSAYPSVAPSSIPTPMATSSSYSSYDSPSVSPSSGTVMYSYPSASPTYSSGYYVPSPYPYYGGSYFSNNFDEYVMSEFEEAKTTGYTGSYLSVVKDIVNPILAGLSLDSRLISSYGNTNKRGVTAENINPIPSYNPEPSSSITPMTTPTPLPPNYVYTITPNYQWQFTYVSNSKKEIYSILVSSSEVLVLKQKWKLKQLVTNNIKIDSNKAIEIAENAIKNKNFTTLNPYPSAVPYYYGNNQTQSEILYEIPENSSLAYSLYEEAKGQLVWNININMNEYSSEYYYSGGYVKIDAQTGNILALDRITKHKNYYYPTPTYSPYYSPNPVATAFPTP